MKLKILILILNLISSVSFADEVGAADASLDAEASFDVGAEPVANKKFDQRGENDLLERMKFDFLVLTESMFEAEQKIHSGNFLAEIKESLKKTVFKLNRQLMPEPKNIIKLPWRNI